MFLLNSQDITLILLAICIIPIAVLIIAAIVVRLRKINKNHKNKFDSISKQDKDLEQKNIFILAYGGNDNIISIANERNKIIVKVKDCDKVNGEKLKELGATGVLIIGDEVKCSFSDRASFIYEMIK